MTSARVHWDGQYSSFEINWDTLVTIPAQQGYFIQAFASADAILDSTAESILRQIYNSFEAQSLLNGIHSLRGRVGFDGSAIFLMLKNNKVIGEKLYNRIVEFKKKRNLVLHNMEAEYSLIPIEELAGLSSQELYDQRAREEAQNVLSDVFRVFMDLDDVSARIVGNEKEHLFPGRTLSKFTDTKGKL